MKTNELKIWTVCLTGCATPAGILHARSVPNIVVIQADDQGWGDLSCNGNLSV
ncbi:MAG: hypothetical protein LBR08_02640 [Bacteroidales bacterium]|jgi:hypothetical protein|nr:hypothetical protein [Bacteroidales bacterium]